MRWYCASLMTPALRARAAATPTDAGGTRIAMTTPPARMRHVTLAQSPTQRHLDARGGGLLPLAGDVHAAQLLERRGEHAGVELNRQHLFFEHHQRGALGGAGHFA